VLGDEDTSPFLPSYPQLSTSLQISPGRGGQRPNQGAPPTEGSWYEDGIIFGPETSLNVNFYGDYLKSPDDPKKSYQTDSLSGVLF